MVPLGGVEQLALEAVEAREAGDRRLVQRAGSGYEELCGDGVVRRLNAPALAPLVTPDWAKRGYAWLFNETILQADEGCDFDFMRENGKG